MTFTPSSFALGAALADPSPALDTTGLTFVTVEDGLLDPLLVAARLAAQTARIGVLAAAPTTVTEPFHVSTAVATIDFVSCGRAGWVASVLPREEADPLVTWDVPDDVVGDAAEHVEVVRRLWDSWEEGAVIRDAATDRYVDRQRIHHVDFRGRFLSVRGPSITPRPPQGHPVVVARGVAIAGADLVLTRDASAPDGDGPPRILELDAGDALADRVAAAHADGFVGALVHGAVPTDLVAALAERGVPVTLPEGTLRERLGLPPAANRYAATEAAR